MTRIIHRLGRVPRLEFAGFALACIALFVALGGAGEAASTLSVKKNSIKSKHIATGQVKSSDIADNGVQSVDVRDGQIGLMDLSGSAKAALLAILDGSVTTSKLADGAVTPPKLADDAVTSEKVLDSTITGADVAPETLTSADLATNSVGATELAANTVQTDEVEDGSLNGVDIGKTAGTYTYDPPNLAAGDCDYEPHGVPSSAGVTQSDQVVVSPEADFNPESLPAVVYGMASSAANVIRIVVCNPGNAAVDLPSTTFHYTVIDN
jgi:hypothetical protein